MPPSDLKQFEDDPTDDMLDALWGSIDDLGMDQNGDGSLMSHVTVECNAKGYPV